MKIKYLMGLPGAIFLVAGFALLSSLAPAIRVVAVLAAALLVILVV